MNISNDIPVTNTILKITTIIFDANSGRNIMPKCASKQDQKLNLVYEAMMIIACLRIHWINKQLNIFIYQDRLKV